MDPPQSFYIPAAAVEVSAGSRSKVAFEFCKNRQRVVVPPGCIPISANYCVLQAQAIENWFLIVCSTP